MSMAVFSGLYRLFNSIREGLACLEFPLLNAREFVSHIRVWMVIEEVFAHLGWKKQCTPVVRTYRICNSLF
ncbi:hypothetical protein C488_15642 [Natrinema pellirubrum DSM 15624]|uniref:Uncharacterized protein n=1 Tax=Natrinema pellirubrum (strain DSM 15624 / CIP 106293 / JCM 10476 / NCIMB 786 / 157) TaxID=797303 RepID=L9YEV3_NATP1|nr:hypothetical protein C488_15642 [Natrinema pellirubrum DSM 15624]